MVDAVGVVGTPPLELLTFNWPRELDGIIGGGMGVDVAGGKEGKEVPLGRRRLWATSSSSEGERVLDGERL